MKNPAWAVHKFGGTSVGDAKRYKAVAGIIASQGRQQRRAIVVSAMKGVTDSLLDLVQMSRKRDKSYLAHLQTLKKKHLDTIIQMLSAKNRKTLSERIESDFHDLEEVLRGIWLAGTASDRIEELVSGFGEIWSAQILSALLNENKMRSQWMDAREILVVDPQEHSVTVDWKRSAANLKKWQKRNPGDLIVITGFVASTVDGIATTLRRNGSDFSASIFGALLDAAEIQIWTDVDGVMSADPRLVPEAVVLSELSYNEVTELAYFGAKVVHPATMEPAIRKGIPIWIRNTFNPKHPGTKIYADAQSDSPVKGFSAVNDIALINVEGTGMIGVPGVAERLFGALRSGGVSVVMISQASSEHSICFAVPQKQAELARKMAAKAFYLEIHQGLVEDIHVTTACSILAVVGDNMVKHAGLAGRFFTALGKAGINIRAIAQGSSERNISVVIDGEDVARALRCVHAAFYLSNQTISVGIVGTGLIGNAFLKQIKKQLEFLKTERKIDIRVRGIMNSRKMILDDAQINLEDWETTLEKSSVKSSMKKMIEHLKSGHLPHTVLIDATASAEIPAHYPDWLRAGLNIITPNKKANTADIKIYRGLKDAARDSHRYFLYSTNVGAGLPIIQTLRDLHHTGDKIIQIEGILSGTLSYIFNSFDGKQAFSEIVTEARAHGYTEPDPRDDLSGMDVARKLVILARELGLQIEVEDVKVQSLVPSKLRGENLETYLKRLPENDREMMKLLQKAKKKKQVLRYVGSIDAKGNAKVALTPYPVSHPFARVSGSDNIVAFRTVRYDHQPLVIQGPGAGPEVTAAGVFADLLRLASYLGATQ